MNVEIEESHEYQMYWYLREMQDNEGENELPNVEDQIEKEEME